MTDNVVPFFPGFTIKKASEQEMREMLASLPLAFSVEHCSAARLLLGWSTEALAFRSGVSVKAIERFEAGQQELHEVSLIALSFAFEREGLFFVKGSAPMRGTNIQGVTQDPKLRSDYGLLD
nr:helix-turn-helix transcriptional regulator [Pseudomonas luteola]